MRCLLLLLCIPAGLLAQTQQARPAMGEAANPDLIAKEPSPWE